MLEKFFSTFSQIRALTIPWTSWLGWCSDMRCQLWDVTQTDVCLYFCFSFLTNLQEFQALCHYGVLSEFNPILEKGYNDKMWCGWNSLNTFRMHYSAWCCPVWCLVFNSVHSCCCGWRSDSNREGVLNHDILPVGGEERNVVLDFSLFTIFHHSFGVKIDKRFLSIRWELRPL